MRWIQASLTLIVLLIALASSKADAAEERPGPLDVAGEVADDGLLGAEFHSGSAGSFDTAESFDSLILPLPVLADGRAGGLLPSLDIVIAAPAILVDYPPIALIGQRRATAGVPVTAAMRLAWLQRFLF